MDYNFHMITADDTDRVLKFLRRFFFRDEPLNKAIKLIPDGEDSTCIELEEYSMSSLVENLSLMAVSSSGAIIGVILNGKNIACLSIKSLFAIFILLSDKIITDLEIPVTSTV